MVTGPSRQVWRSGSAWRGISVGTVRDLGQGRTHRPEQGSMGKLAGVPGLDDARLQAFARARGSLPNLGA